MAVLLAAISLMLLQIARMQSPSPQFMQRQIANALQRNEQQRLLELVLAGTHPQKLPLDSRYAQFQQLLAAAPRPPSELDEQIAWLKAALAQLGMKIDERSPQAGVAGAAQPPPEPRAEVLFQPRKDPYALKLGATEYQVTILPGNAFPNLNAIDFEPLSRALVQLGVPEREAPELAAALIDWRDADQFSTQGIGAEADYYRGLAQSYAPRNAPIRSWQELTYVRGMTPERVRLVREYFSLGPPKAAGLSIAYGSLEAFTALTGFQAERVKELMGAYGRLADPDRPIEGVLLSSDATEFEKVAALEADTTVLRVRIRSPESELSADYDTRGRKLMAVW